MKTLRCSYIKYDTDGQELELPTTLTLTVESDLTDFDLEDALADQISNRTGWLVESFIFEEVQTDAR